MGRRCDRSRLRLSGGRPSSVSSFWGGLLLLGRGLPKPFGLYIVISRGIHRGVIAALALAGPLGDGAETASTVWGCV